MQTVNIGVGQPLVRPGGIDDVPILALTLFAINRGVSRKLPIQKPLRRMAKVTDTVRETGDYTQRAEWQSGDEIGRLVLGFNSMLAQIQERDQELRRDAEARQRALDWASGHLGELPSLSLRKLQITYANDRDGLRALESFDQDTFLSDGARRGLGALVTAPSIPGGKKVKITTAATPPAGTTAATTGTVNTAAATTLAISGQKAVGTDTLRLYAYSVELVRP